ncbi:MAG: polysaccharide biosynthesis/export family protein [Vicinamibacterales bacterium]
MPSKTLRLVLVISALICPGRALAQEPPAVAATPDVALAGVADYEIGPGDVLSISVSGFREFEQSIRVSNSGRIRVPYVGIMFAAGMTAIQLEREIAQQIRDHELVNEPMVRVQVDQHRARPVHVVGEVTTPGQFVITGEMYLLDLVSRAGGLTAGADGTGILYRRGVTRPSVTARIATASAPLDAPAPPTDTPEKEPTSEAQLIPINLDDLRSGKRPDLNIPLEGGDVLYVPRRQGQTMYIIGDVNVPGAYTLPRHGIVTATQAITYAGGPLATAKSKAGFLVRHDANGVRQAIPIDFNAIIRGKKPDVTIQADDIIYIPSSAFKTVGVGLLNQVARLIQQFVIF